MGTKQWLRGGWGSLLVLVILWTTGVNAQVDWSDLFPGEGGGAVKAPAAAPSVKKAEPPPPAKAVAPPAARPAAAAPKPAPAPPVARVEPERQPAAVVPPVPARPVQAVPKPAVARPAPVAVPPPPAAPVEEPETARVAPAPRPQEAAPAAPPAAKAEAGAQVGLAELGLSEGAEINAANVAQYQRLVNPGMEWAVGRGWRMHVTAPKPLTLPRLYVQATEKYSGQIRMGANGFRLENYVAGRPFPHIDANAPDAALRIMWNYYYNSYVIDDVSQNDFDPRTGTIRREGPLDIERAYIVDSYRKMNYTGRLYVDPKPALPNPEGVRFKESLHPIIEPFDLKGVGTTFYRYLDPSKQDDSWVYLPQLRRVRRMSSAQRSDALFGQDTDADSFGGYNGQIGWMQFVLLGDKVILLPVHAHNLPAKWQQPEDWAFDDLWEPRRVWVVEARSKSSQYAFSKRVLYVDQEAFIIPASDSYDRAGQLWKAQINLWAQISALSPDSKLARYDEPMLHQISTVIMDTQLSHATSTAIPSGRAKIADTFVLNKGAKKGVTEDYFTVANLIASGR
jgi:hypothetical protein